MHSAVFRLSLCVLTLAAVPANLRASTLYWEGAGNGTWDTTSAVWHLDSPGGTLVAWDNAGNHDAVFEGTGGTITLASGITARSVSFATDGFVLTGNTITLAAGSGTVNVQASLSAAINSSIAGVVGLTKTGDGTLELGGANSYAGPTLILAGTVKLVGGGAPPVARYTFDGNTQDSSEGQHNGTITGGGTSYISGRFGQALSFTGSQFVTVPYSADFNLNSFTVSSWVSLSSTPQGANFPEYGILGTRRAGMDETFDVKVGAARIHGDVGNGSSWINASVDIADTDKGSNGQGGNIAAVLNVWHMVTYVIDNSAKEFRLYIDADLKKTYPFTGVPQFVNSGVSLRIGDCDADPAEFMKGALDELCIFDYPLSQTGIANLYVNDLANGLPSATALVLSGNGTFDLNGFKQTIGSLSGSVGTRILLNDGELTCVTNSDTDFAGVISGTGGLKKSGGSTLTLSNSGNSYSGATTIIEGRIKYGAANAIPSGAGKGGVSVAESCLLDLNGFSSAVNDLTGVGTVASNTPGNVTFSVGGGNASGNFAGVIADGAGVVSLEKIGTGIISLSNGNSYSGTTRVSAGTLRLSAGASTPSQAHWMADSVTGADGSPVSTWTDSVGGIAASQYTGDEGTVFGVPTLNTSSLINGHQTLRFSGTNQTLQVTPAASPLAAAGDFTIACVFKPTSAGIGPANQWYDNAGLVDSEQSGEKNDFGLVWSSTRQIGAGLGGTSGASAVTRYSAVQNFNTTHVVIYARQSGTITLNVDGTITSLTGASTANRTPYQILFGSTNFTVNGAGVLKVARNFFTGEIAEIQLFQSAIVGQQMTDLMSVLGAKYGLGGFGNGQPILPIFTAVTVAAGATLDLNGANTTIGSLAGEPGSSVKLGTGKLTTGGNGSTTEFAGVISQSGTLTKNGSGLMTLSGVNTYSGATTVTGAGSRLAATQAGAFGSSTGVVTVQSGARLIVNFAAPASIGNPLSLNGDGGGSGALSIQQGSVTWNAPVTLASDVMINTAPTTDLTLSQTLSGAGGLSKNGTGTLVVSGASSYTGATAVFAGVLQFDGTFSSANSVAVASGAVLRAGPAGMSMSSLAINDSGILSLRVPTSVSAPKLTVNGTATFGALSILQLDLENYPDGGGNSFTIVDAQTIPAQIGSLNKVNDSGTPETPVVDYINGARQTVVLTLNTVPETTLAVSDTSIQFNASSQSVLLSAAVTSAGGPVNTGTVSFQVKQDQTNIGSGVTSGTVNNGAASATYTIPAGTAAGNYSINAGYSGASNFKPSSDNAKTLTITKAATGTTPANSTAPYSFADQTVSVSVQITSSAGVVNEGTVTVQLKNGAANLGTAVTSAPVANGSTAVNYTIPGGTLPAVYTIQASYGGGVNFAASSDNAKTVTILKTTPVITWPDPADIAYGTALGATQLNASAGGIPGTFVYNPASGTILAVGSGQQLSVTFTPNDTVNYNSAQKTVTLNVSKKVLTVTADNQSKLFGSPNPPLTASYSGFVNGETAAVLTGAPILTTSVTTSTPPGNYPITITQGTLNAANYSFTFVNGALTVSNQPAFFNLSAPSVPYATPTTNLNGKISFGVTGAVSITFNGVTKSATIDASGFFSADFNTQSLELGTYPIQYFYPGGGAVGSASDTRTLTVIKATPVISWSNPADIPYGTQLSDAQLNATANVAGNFAHNPAAGTVLNIGAHQLSVNFAPADAAHYSDASANVTLVVGLAQAVITWANPADISYGTALSDAQLNAAADIPGTLTYDPPAGTILNAGGAQQLKLTFAPNDSANYATSVVTVTINVLKADQAITFAQIPDQEIGSPALTLSATASSNLPVTITLVSGNATLQGGTLTLLGLGAITLRAEQFGDANFNAAPTLEQTFHVIIIPPHITSALSSSGTQNQPFAFTLTASGTQPVTFESGTLPPGLSLNANTGDISGTPTASGAFQVAVTARNGGGTETKTLTLVFASSSGGENHAPKFVSRAVATPNPATVNAEIAFSVSASDEDGDSVAIVWDFGDGTQGFGSSTTHRYAAAGIFAAKVTLTDGAASDYLNLTIVVNGSVIPPEQYAQFTAAKLALKFNFAKANADSLSISGTIPLPPAFVPLGKIVEFQSGDLERAFTLDKKGASPGFKLTGKLAKDGSFTASPAKYALALKNQSLFADLQVLGFINDNTPKGMIVVMPVVLTIENVHYLATLNVAYSAKKGKSSAGKK